MEVMKGDGENLQEVTENSLEITESLEDYLKVIYCLKKDKGTIKVKDVASKLNVKPSSVVEALKKLSRKNLISYEKYGEINLNETGTKMAEKIIRKNEVLKNFLNLIGVDRETAEREACALEHALKLDTIEKIEIFTKKSN